METIRSTAIAALLYKNIDDITVLVSGSSKVVQLAANLYEDLIQVPNITLLSTPPLQLAGVFWAELHAPLSNRLVADLDASLR